MSLLSHSAVVSYFSYDSSLIGNCDILYRSQRDPNDTGNKFSALMNNISIRRILCVKKKELYHENWSVIYRMPRLLRRHCTAYCYAIAYCYDADGRRSALFRPIRRR